MKVADFINSSEGVYRIALYFDGEDVPICYTRSDWQGIAPYMSRELSYFEIVEGSPTKIGQVDIYIKKATNNIWREAYKAIHKKGD